MHLTTGDHSDYAVFTSDELPGVVLITAWRHQDQHLFGEVLLLMMDEARWTRREVDFLLGSPAAHLQLLRCALLETGITLLPQCRVTTETFNFVPAGSALLGQLPDEDEGTMAMYSKIIQETVCPRLREDLRATVGKFRQQDRTPDPVGRTLALNENARGR